MQITQLTIKNYRSFDQAGQTINFPTPHCALVGKNNAGKSNILNALELILGSKNPAYAKFEDDDYFDSTQPIEITASISNIVANDRGKLFSIPELTQQQKGALNTKISNGTANITFLLRKNLEYIANNEGTEEIENSQDIFDINLWGFTVHRKKDDVRKSIVRMLIVPAIRDHDSELTASKWTSYGQLMKEVLEGSPKYADIKRVLTNLNSEIQAVFQTEKRKLLQGAKIVSYVDDIDFQLTKDNNPSELLRNLEIFITEGQKRFNIKYVGTGTQSAIIIGILELALKSKSARLKFFGIEEPEAFIHPHGIRYLGSLVKNISSDQSTQVIISTHSLSLTANFEPKEIILVGKDNGKTIIRQNTSLTSTHYRRFIHQDNAEIFFSDRVIFVEGPTEKHLFSNLDKTTKQDPSDPDSEDCNFDRVNVGIIKMDSVDSILNYAKVANAFNIPFVAIVDNDFLVKSSCKTLCSELSINYQTTNKNQLITDLRSKNIFVNTRGEIEDLFPDQDIANASGKTLIDVQNIKSVHPLKTSQAFKEVFGTGKVEYAIKLADYYTNNMLSNPLEDLIRKIYTNDSTNISF